MNIAGFGTFSVKSRPERQGRNARTGESITIAASTVPAFKAAKALRRGGKHGRGAPGKTPFVSAVQLHRGGSPVRMCLSRVGAFQSDEIAAWTKCHLEPGTLVFCDALGCFSAVQRAGCFHQPFVTGGGPDSAQHPALSWVNTILGNIKCSLHGSYHYVSSKHLPRYLAEFSYWFNR